MDRSVSFPAAIRPERGIKCSETAARNAMHRSGASRSRAQSSDKLPAMKPASCGILVCNTDGELLMCHATGGSYWDLPKGTGEPGESPVQTALRETAEECALVFDPADLIELGRFRYRPAKDLHLFAARTERLDIGPCRCSTHFRDRFGREWPEMDDFAWVPFDGVPLRCAKSMGVLLATALPLQVVAARLHERGVVARPQWVSAEAPG